MLQSIFKWNGIPFFVLGGQVHNSSAYNLTEMETAWKALEALHANTAEVPIYWSQFEPRPGKYHYQQIDQLIQAAREHKLKLILLWFATWKNGSMQYAPEWVKLAPDRFQRVITHAGNRLWVLSSHAEANLEADRNAFCTLLNHLKEVDGDQRTVIGVQIENEPGILGAVRDHSPLAESEFSGQVPDELMQKLQLTSAGPVRDAWALAGKRSQGNWQQVFGPHAAEFFSAWSIARYIDRIAEAGKAVYDLPFYVNVWLGENGWQQPGISYPSGGPVSRVLDIWKWATPHLDLIAPDIYIDTPDTYREVCQAYAREDNPLFVPESALSQGNALNVFEAIHRYRAVGYAVFGIESLLDAQGAVKPSAQPLVDSFRILASVQPLLLQFWKTNRMVAIIQREFQSEQLLDLGEYLALVQFSPTTNAGWIHTDYRHSPADFNQRGRGLLFQAPNREFFVAGAGFTLQIKRRRGETSEFSKAHDHFDAPLTPYLRVEEGRFGILGEWIPTRERNGDEITAGIWVTPDIGVVRFVLAE